jgi:hypothetical protein
VLHAKQCWQYIEVAYDGHVEAAITLSQANPVKMSRGSAFCSYWGRGESGWGKGIRILQGFMQECTSRHCKHHESVLGVKIYKVWCITLHVRVILLVAFAERTFYRAK